MNQTKIELAADITTILAKHDPLDLAQYSDTEYDIEAEEIAERILDYDVDQSDFPFVIKNEFDRKFGEVAKDITKETYFAISDDVYIALTFALARHSVRMQQLSSGG
jgi:hypothetical protein